MTETLTEIEIDVPARDAALAWLNAFLATGDDEMRPDTNHTIAIEVFDHGLQFVALDGALLLRTFVAAKEGEPWPDLAEDPNRTLVVSDLEGFGVGFMRSLLRATSDEEYEHARLAVGTAPADEGATLALGAEFMSERLVLRACGMRIDLKLFEGNFPSWRRASLPPETREQVAIMNLGPERLALLGKLRNVSRMECAFFGEEKAVHLNGFHLGQSQVRGMLMPQRRDAL